MNNFYFNGYDSDEMSLIVEEKSIYNGPQPDFVLTNPEPYPLIPDVTVNAGGSITLNLNSKRELPFS